MRAAAKLAGAVLSLASAAAAEPKPAAEMQAGGLTVRLFDYSRAPTARETAVHDILLGTCLDCALHAPGTVRKPRRVREQYFEIARGDGAAFVLTSNHAGRLLNALCAEGGKQPAVRPRGNLLMAKRQMRFVFEGSCQ